jgi:hypothetical protein
VIIVHREGWQDYHAGDGLAARKKPPVLKPDDVAFYGPEGYIPCPICWPTEEP